MWPKVYKWFNNDKEDNTEVLIKNENIRIGNFVVAKKCYHGIRERFVFMKFKNVTHFFDVYQKLEEKERVFYSVWTQQYRYLYLDIDYKRTGMQHDDKLIIQCMDLLRRFMEQQNSNKIIIHGEYQKHWYLWTANRKDKFSLHVINSKIVMHVEDMKELITKMKTFSIEHKIFADTFMIDLNVYKTQYQLFKLPYSHGKTIDSTFILYREQKKKCNLEMQLKLHDMNNLRENNKVKIVCNRAKRNEESNVQQMSNTLRITDEYNMYTVTSFGYTWKLKIVKSYDHFKRQYKMLGHICPIAGRRHKRNEAYIHCCTLQTVTNQKDIEYIKYRCMHDYCVKKQFRYSFDIKIKCPWMFDNGIQMDIKVMKDIEMCIQILTEYNIINELHELHPYDLLKVNKIQYDRKSLEFSTFFCNDISHLECKAKGCMQLKHYGNYTDNGTEIHCRACKVSYSICGGNVYRNDKIIQKKNSKHTTSIKEKL